MHGTFRSHVERGTIATVRFDARAIDLPGRRWPTKAALLLAGCCLAALPQLSSRPTVYDKSASPAPRAIRPSLTGAPISRSSRRERLIATAAVGSADHRPAPAVRAQAKGVEPPQPAPLAQPVEPLDAVFVTLPEPTPAASIQSIEAEPLAASPIAIDLPAPPTPPVAVADAPTAAVAPAAPEPAPTEALRPVDIAQISDSDVPSLRVPQLHEPGLAVGGEPDLSAKIAAMQVTPLPPVRYPQSERAVLLAEAPTQMMVRIGVADVGKVDFRMTDQGTVDVKLAGLLDLLAGHYDAAEFTRLRTSAAADAYVSFDKLRAMGLNVRYDPVYDEVRIAG